MGHKVLHDYFDEQLSTARAIDRAVVEADHDALGKEFERSSQVAATARDRILDDYKPLVRTISRFEGN